METSYREKYDCSYHTGQIQYYGPNSVFQTQKGSFSCEFTAVVTACTRTVQTQSRQNPQQIGKHELEFFERKNNSGHLFVSLEAYTDIFNLSSGVTASFIDVQANLADFSRKVAIHGMSEILFLFHRSNSIHGALLGNMREGLGKEFGELKMSHHETMEEESCLKSQGQSGPRSGVLTPKTDGNLTRGHPRYSWTAVYVKRMFHSVGGESN
ncbi:hypothetical protein H671_1g0956 [Cricetulus griseus]|nr:hypothetical protein H671_1g0956 [Cricetulus griseus]